jgi:hypothetical protein
MPTPKRAKLKRVKTKEVSLVPAGAVNRTFCLSKEDAIAMQKQILEDCLKTELENEADIDAALAKAETDPKAAEAIKAAIRLLTAFKDVLQPGDVDLLAEILNGPSEETEGGEVMAENSAQADAEGENKDADAQKSAAPTVKKAATSATEEAPDMNEEHKARFEALTKAHAAAEERLNKLQKALEEKEHAERLRACVSKAQTSFANLGPADQVGRLLKKLEDAGLAKDAEEILRGANERAKSDALFKEYGNGPQSSMGEDSSPGAQLMKHAEEISKAQNIPLTKAHVMACERHPELYEAFDKANKKREGR